MENMGSRARANGAAKGVDLPTDTITRRGLRDDVYDRVLELLLRGDTQPGTRLSIESLARKFGVSPTPVREALIQFERTGLVTRESLRGYRIAPPLSKDQLEELFVAREMLESTAAQLATASLDDLLPELREAHERHRASGAAIINALNTGMNDVSLSADYYARDRDFHDVIFRHAGNRYLVDMSDNLGALLHRVRQMVHRGVTDVREAISEHQAVVDAFAVGDPQGVAQAIRSHIENVRARSLYDEEHKESGGEH